MGGSQSSRRVAIVDGHALAREGLAELVASKGAWEVVYAGSDPHDAISARPDVIILSLDGIPPGGTAAKALSIFGSIPVVVTSSAVQPDGIRRALMSGALGHVSRNQSFEDLHQAMTSAVQGERHLSPDLPEIMAATGEIPDLSPRELQALRLYAGGHSMSQVASAMSVSPHTAREYVDRVRSKYDQRGRVVRTRTELYAQALRDGFLHPDE